MSDCHLEFYLSDPQLRAELSRQHWELHSSARVGIAESAAATAVPSGCGFVRVTAEAACFVNFGDSTPNFSTAPRIYIAAGIPELIARRPGDNLYVRQSAEGDPL